MEQQKKSGPKALIIVLIVLLIGAMAYMFYSKNEHKKLTDAIEEEKMEIEQNLDSMIVKYEDAIGQNTSLSNELAFERDRIIVLRDSIKDLKATNYSLIRRYRKEIAKLEETNQRLFYLNDSLSGVTEQLTVELDEAGKKIEEQLAIVDTLTTENLNLATKVAIGSILKVNDGMVVSMRERSNGKLVSTSRARSTDAFRVQFTIDKNEISEPGERMVYIQLVDASGNVISRKGSVELENGSIGYSDMTTINYMNEELDVISLINVDRKSLAKGDYLANIFVGERFTNSFKVTLK
jgi:hypothetical protein